LKKKLANQLLNTSQIIRRIFAYDAPDRLAMCVHRMFALRQWILDGKMDEGETHPDRPHINRPPRDWWNLGLHENVIDNNFCLLYANGFWMARWMRAKLTQISHISIAHLVIGGIVACMRTS
jgi:hypothetical protein